MGRRGLGRGLSALIATGESVGGLKFEEIPTSAVRPNTHQPRSTFPEVGIKELAASIREVGILQPLVVRSTDSGFELIAGERRLRAAKEAGLDRVPVLIRQAADNESMELALVENLQREDLNPIETAAAYQALMESFGITKEALANRLGKSRATVANTLRLGQLPDHIREMLLEGSLTEGHARALLGLRGEEQMSRLAEKVKAEKLSVRKTEESVRQQNTEPQERVQDTKLVTRTAPEEYMQASQVIGEFLSLPVKVSAHRRGGKLEIRFQKQEELESLVELLTPNKEHTE